jgi:hypothetical protein
MRFGRHRDDAGVGLDLGELSDATSDLEQMLRDVVADLQAFSGVVSRTRALAQDAERQAREHTDERYDQPC